jgi:hypothetical protein
VIGEEMARKLSFSLALNICYTSLLKIFNLKFMPRNLETRHDTSIRSCANLSGARLAAGHLLLLGWVSVVRAESVGCSEHLVGSSGLDYFRRHCGS